MNTPIYRIQLSRHSSRKHPASLWRAASEHYTLIRIMRGGREVARAHSHLYDSFADAVRAARRMARVEAQFLRSLRSVS